MRRLIVIMGPSGCGKSTLASGYARRIGAGFVEADEHHPAANVARMRAGTPLDDSHRVAWLDSLLPAVNAQAEETVVLACSALTPFVQHRLAEESSRPVIFVFCDVPEAELARRLGEREGHFMPPGLLASQLDALHLPENVVRVDADAPVATVLERIAAALDDQR